MTVRAWIPEPKNTGARDGSVATGERVTILTLITTLLAAIFAFGSDRNDFALFFSGLLALELLVVLPSQHWAKSAIVGRSRELLIPACLFGMSCLAIIWAAGPYGPDGSHPIWEYVGTLPALAIDRSAIFIGLIKLAGLAFAFLLGWIICTSDERARYFFRAFVTALAAYAVWALLARVIPALNFGIYDSFQVGRLSASLQNANIAGTLFAVGFLAALCLVFEDHRRLNNGASTTILPRIASSIIIALIFGTSLILTVSRGATTATLAGGAIFLIWEAFAREWRGAKKRSLLYGLAFGGGLVVLAYSGNLLVDRYADSVKDWVGQRQIIYNVHWAAFLASPWFGYGLGSFDEVNRILENAINYPALWDVRAAHNVYLQWLEQAGVVGALPMFLCIFWIIARTALGAVKRRRMTTWLRGCVAISLIVLVHGWSDFSIEIPAFSMLWSVLLGSGYALSASSQSRQDISDFRNLNSQDATTNGSGALVMWSFALVAGLTSLICFGSFWEIDAPFGKRPLVFPISFAYAYQAQDLLNKQPSGNPDVASLTAARAFTEDELVLSPAHAGGWLRLAVISAISNEPKSKTAQLLDRSYTVAPFSAELFEVRTRFALEHWDRITPPVREEALEQIRVGWENWLQKDMLLKLAHQIRNPAGNLVINLQIKKMSSDQ